MTLIKEIFTALQSNEVHASLITSSIQRIDDVIYAAIQEGTDRYPIIVVDNEVQLKDFDVIEKDEVSSRIIAKLSKTTNNRRLLAKSMTWMNPVPRTGNAYSFGLGDRLGLASNAHLKLFRGTGILPVLAQQSIRELNLTGRTFVDVLDSAAWSVFEEGYTDGYSADGDHLKTPFEVEYAIQSGFPMLTLDCSEHINNDVENYDADKLLNTYESIGINIREDLEKRYLNASFELANGDVLEFSKETLMKSVLIFNDAISFATMIYERFVKPNNMDFEISIDETIVPTTPENHYFIANELYLMGVSVETMAPKFHGEFQKGIDYRGNLQQFESEYITHEAIAKTFGYRLSIHSGSDKFTVFPIINQLSDKGWHVKTAGTNWLEALKVIAKNDPLFMIDIYRFALDNLQKAKAYYHIDGTVENAILLSTVTEENVMELLNDDMTRQVLHVTYGLILNEKKDNEYVFKTKLYSVLKEHIEDYNLFLNSHIRKHLTLLGREV